MNMSKNTKLEVALEILAAKIGKMSQEGYTQKDSEMQVLLQQRERMYAGDEETIETIIELYGPEIKQSYEGV